MPASSFTCKAVSPECPPEKSIYGSYLSLGGNAFFLAAFAVLFLLQVGIGIRKKTWTFTIAVSLGCVAEVIGYAGRLIGSTNPFSVAGIGMNILCLIVAPSFMAAGIYLTLKHVVLFSGPEYSRLQPKWYPRIFILCDVCSILIQLIGGALDATASSGSPSLINAGNAVIITGIVLQVVTMSIFGTLALDYYLRRCRLIGSTVQTKAKGSNATSSDEENPEPSMPAHSEYTPSHFKLFLYGIIFAYTTIMIRCIYRIAEMAGGWKGPIMQNEPSFLVLDGAMILLAAIALTVVHPGFLFKPMTKGRGGW